VVIPQNQITPRGNTCRVESGQAYLNAASFVTFSPSSSPRSSRLRGDDDSSSKHYIINSWNRNLFSDFMVLYYEIMI
jgi:hypothetical protein